MPIKFPFHQTKNNQEFSRFLNDVIDGDLFYKRFDTDNFITHVVCDHRVQVRGGRYLAQPHSAAILLTSKATGEIVSSYTDPGRPEEIKELYSRLGEGDETVLLTSVISPVENLFTRVKGTCVGNVYRAHVMRGGAIENSDLKLAMNHLFSPVDEVDSVSVLGKNMKHIMDVMSKRERHELADSSNRQAIPSMDFSTDFKFSFLFNKPTLDNFLLIDSAPGKEDVTSGLEREFRPPTITLSSDIDIENMEAKIGGIRYQKSRNILNSARLEAMRISAKTSYHGEMSDKQIDDAILDFYQPIEAACQNDSEKWDIFLGKSFHQVRNRVQMLDGPLQGNVTALECLLSDESFREAIDSGTSLREPLRGLPLLSASKKSLSGFLNNISATVFNRGDRAPFLITEGGQIPARRINHALPIMKHNSENKRPFLELISSIYCIPDKYHRSGETLEMAMNMPFADESIVTSIKKMKSGEWTPEQAFSWMRKLDSIDTYQTLYSKVSDTERILAEYYMDSLVGHVLYHAGVGADVIDETRDLDPVDMDQFIKDFVSSKPYKHLINLSDDLHRYSQRLMKVSAPTGQVGWNPAIESDYSEEGISITPIHSTLDMSQEGLMLNHCVGTYIKDAMEGQTFIFGVRDAEGNRLSTFEVKINEDYQYELIQHFAYGNTAPSDKEARVVGNFMEAIDSGEIAFNEETHVSKKDIDKLTDIERSEVQAGIRYSDPRVAEEIISHLGEICSDIDVFDYLRSELSEYRDLEEHQDAIMKSIDKLETSYNHKFEP